MEDVEVVGKGPRAQRVLDEMEAGARGITLISDTSGGGEVRRVYRVEASESSEAEQRIAGLLDKAAREFRILTIP